MLFKSLARNIGTGILGSARAFSTVQPLDSSKMVVVRRKDLKPKPNMDTVAFGAAFTDHMLTVEWSKDQGWQPPRIVPHGPFVMDPAAQCLHYALECFEGMKAYKDTKGQIRLFRPDMNVKRLQQSASRLCLPAPDETEFIACLKALLKTEVDWIPDKRGFSLYVRPTLISTTPWLGVGPCTEALLYVLLSPVGAYYKNGFNPVRLLADPQHVRAWPGGVGNRKVGGNYAPGIVPQMEAAAKGYDQNLWLQGEDHLVTEVGTMNIFFFWRNAAGEDELVTAPLAGSSGTILPGVTRDSVLALAREMGGFKVSERDYTMKEVVAAIEEGRMHEAFGSGTAAIVSPVKCIGYMGTDYDVPVDRSNPEAKIGQLANKVLNELMDIQYGTKEHPWSVVV